MNAHATTHPTRSYRSLAAHISAALSRHIALWSARIDGQPMPRHHRMGAWEQSIGASGAGSRRPADRWEK
jgi:hypothetical protein